MNTCVPLPPLEMEMLHAALRRQQEKPALLGK